MLDLLEKVRTTNISPRKKLQLSRNQQKLINILNREKRLSTNQISKLIDTKGVHSFMIRLTKLGFVNKEKVKVWNKRQSYNHDYYTLTAKGKSEVKA